MDNVSTTTERWICPSDAELTKLAESAGRGWCSRSNQPITGIMSTPLRDDEWLNIRTVIRIAEHYERREQKRINQLIGKATALQAPLSTTPSPYQCHLCVKTFNIITQIWLAKCPGCLRAVCKLCRVSTSGEPTLSSSLWQCKACLATIELWKTSGAWFHGTLPPLNSAAANNMSWNHGSVSGSQTLPRLSRSRSIEPSLCGRGGSRSSTPDFLQVQWLSPDNAGVTENVQDSSATDDSDPGVRSPAKSSTRQTKRQTSIPSWQNVDDLQCRAKLRLGRAQSNRGN